MQSILIVRNPMPLCFQRSRSRAVAETLTYIPGSSAVGGLAAAHRRLQREAAADFEDFFLSRKVRFSNLYPANFAHDDLTDETLPVAPLPFTASSCKYFSGFRFNAGREDEERHGVVDRLIPWTLFALSGRHAVKILNAYRDCFDSCPETLDRFTEGFYRYGYTPEAMGLSTIPRRLLTRTGVSRRRGAVQESILYNREVLAENQTFRGTVECDDAALLHKVTTFVKEASARELIYLGNNKSRGLGKVSAICEQPSVPQDTVADIEARVQDFTNRLTAKAKEHGQAIPSGLYISITLHSDLILRDALLRYRTDLNPPIRGMEPVYQNTVQGQAWGWNRFLGVPKAIQNTISMGSVFLFRYTGVVDLGFWQQLKQLQDIGIGERRSEGFGRVKIADPFHKEEQPR